ncbi:Lrp/AsnC family transcriptional regulator [Calderihabitans maritimus]|uniref:AsnC family transcriptional regulator n=1 Tax=Calderihabitans maritimus TaxID=1246530 RepID=A0A1Z5HRB0_9FIRM|nr:Lrp/AsnC family transcriptional regulator [Calderihabitans maritimus]GAW91855.1 AsnC family transcriptional regulator [Calderihabitans maritimus]
MNELRKKILEILERNSRASTREIALMLNVEEKEVIRLIEEMEKEKIILGYNTLINWEKAGEDSVTAMIDVKVVPQRDVGFDEVAERIYRFPEVKSVYLMSGGYDLSVVIEGKTLKEVARFVAEKLATLENVQSTMTHFVLKKYKQAGIVFEDKEEDRRQVVSP